WISQWRMSHTSGGRDLRRCQIHWGTPTEDLIRDQPRQLQLQSQFDKSSYWYGNYDSGTADRYSRASTPCSSFHGSYTGWWSFQHPLFTRGDNNTSRHFGHANCWTSDYNLLHSRWRWQCSADGDSFLQERNVVAWHGNPHQFGCSHLIVAFSYSRNLCCHCSIFRRFKLRCRSVKRAGDYGKSRHD